MAKTELDSNDNEGFLRGMWPSWRWQLAVGVAALVVCSVGILMINHLVGK